MPSKIDDASLSSSLPTSSSTPPSLPRPRAHVVLLLIDGVGDVPCRAFEKQRGNQGGFGSSSSSSSSSSLKSNLTPLQSAAPLPCLDAIASSSSSSFPRSVLGLLDPVQPGKACGSDTAHLSLLGYDPRTYYRGRGAFESLGAGLSMEPGDIAFKCNFATLEEEKEEEKEEKGGQKSGRRGGGEEATPTPPLVVSRRADRAFEAAGPVFCSALDGLRLPSFPWIEVRVKYATEHRAGVVLSMRKQEKTEEEASETSTWTSTSTSPSTSIGNGDEGKRPPPPLFELSDAVSGTDPLKDNLPLRRCVSLLSSSDGEGEEGLGGNGDSEEEMKKRKKDAETTAEIVNELSDEIRRVLESHPLNLERRGQGKAVANALLLRGCGARAPLPDFATKFGFARGCAVAPTKIIAGLALCAGFEVLECARGTGDYRTSLRSKVDAVVGAIERADDEEERKRKSKEEEREEPSPSSSPSAPLFVLLHVKAVDDAGHDRAPFKKMAWLRAVDAALARLVRKLGSKRGEKGGGGSKSPEVVVAVTGDHSTPVEFGDHSCEPVPFAAAPLRAVVEALLLGKNEDEEGGGGEKEGGGEEEIVAPTEEEMRRVVAAAKDKKKKNNSSSPLSFDETSASLGSLGRFPGAEVMPLLVRLSAAWG